MNEADWSDIEQGGYGRALAGAEALGPVVAVLVSMRAQLEAEGFSRSIAEQLVLETLRRSGKGEQSNG